MVDSILLVVEDSITLEVVEIEEVVDSVVEVIVTLPEVTVEVSVTTDCEVGVTVLVSVVTTTLVDAILSQQDLFCEDMWLT